MINYLIPVLLLILFSVGLARKESPYDLMVEGGLGGLKILKVLIPTMVLLLTSVSMLQASGAAQLLSDLAAPVFSFMGIPPETAMLVLIRPISGSAALAVGTDLMVRYGVDSQIGRTAAVMLGSTETTFYTISVYFGAAGIRKIRYTWAAAFIADMTGFIVSALIVNIL